MVANISAYRPKNKTVMHVLTITVALDTALSQALTALAVQAMALRLEELATALRGQVTELRGPLQVLNLATALRVLKLATALRGQDSILPLHTTTSRKTTCRSSRIVTPIQIVILSTNTPYFVDKTVSNALLSTKTPDFVDKTVSNALLSMKTPDFVDKLSDKKNSEVGAFTDLAG